MPFRIAIAWLALMTPLTMHAFDWRSLLGEIVPVRGGQKQVLIWRQINHGERKTLTAGIHGIITCPLRDPVAPLEWAGPQDLGTRAEGLRVYEYTPGFGSEKFVDQPDPARWPSQRWGFGADPSFDTLFEFKRGRRYYLFSNVDFEMTCTKGEQTSSSPVTTVLINPPPPVTVTPTITPTVTPTITPTITPPTVTPPTITPPTPPTVTPTITPTPPIPTSTIAPVVTPGTVTPGTITPGTVTPGTITPGTVTPVVTSGMVTPGLGGGIGELFRGSAGCGDGFLESQEECDDGNIRDFDGCSARCQLEIGICGDGVVQELLGEECEPLLHDAALPYRCTQQCKIASLSCGDGKVDPGEDCDQGKDNSDRPDAACRTTCKLSRCGDGLLDTDEECDDGNLFSGDGCTDLCRIAVPVNLMARGGFPLFPDLPQLPGLPAGAQYTGMPWPVGPGGMSQMVDARGVPIPVSPWTASMVTAPLHSPVGDTGPAILVVMAGGAAAGMAWMRRKQK